jgi:AcrR family transcriptional regulator
MNTGEDQNIGRPKDELLSRRRREEILQMAARMFAEHGFAQTDVQMIADALGVGKGTIYRYFPSKRELFLGAADQGMRMLTEVIDISIHEQLDPLQRMVRAIHRYLHFFDQHPEYVELFIQERAVFKDRKKPTYFEYVDANSGPRQALLAEMVQTGRVRDIPLARIETVVTNALYGILFTTFFDGRTNSFREQADGLLDVLFQGILTDTERARWKNRSGESEET